jgi:hypothetical protein
VLCRVFAEYDSDLDPKEVIAQAETMMLEAAEN